MKNGIVVRNATTADAEAICALLADAFAPYRGHYTVAAYTLTLCSREIITGRIMDPSFDVILATRDDRIVGTATLDIPKPGVLYLRSMAVSRSMQGKGIGFILLQECERRARLKNCGIISLECFAPLKMAIALYRRTDYQMTGKKREYGGIEVFEMNKTIELR